MHPPDLGGDVEIRKRALQIPNDAFFVFASRPMPQFETDHGANRGPAGFQQGRHLRLDFRISVGT